LRAPLVRDTARVRRRKSVISIGSAIKGPQDDQVDGELGVGPLAFDPWLPALTQQRSVLPGSALASLSTSSPA
jgi:hypothetical protein